MNFYDSTDWFTDNKIGKETKEAEGIKVNKAIHFIYP